VAIATGMILSNEPGYYKLNHYGIRTENLLLVKTPEKIKGADRAMLSFETLTFAPIDRRLIDTHMLTRSELQWLDAYHAQALKKLLPLVSKTTKPWLKNACAPLK
jgi:Xaa-Pro aminopeptidase